MSKFYVKEYIPRSGRTHIIMPASESLIQALRKLKLHANMFIRANANSVDDVSVEPNNEKTNITIKVRNVVRVYSLVQKRNAPDEPFGHLLKQEFEV